MTVFWCRLGQPVLKALSVFDAGICECIKKCRQVVRQTLFSRFRQPELRQVRTFTQCLQGFQCILPGFRVIDAEPLELRQLLQGEIVAGNAGPGVQMVLNDPFQGVKGAAVAVRSGLADIEQAGYPEGKQAFSFTGDGKPAKVAVVHGFPPAKLRHRQVGKGLIGVEITTVA